MKSRLQSRIIGCATGICLALLSGCAKMEVKLPDRAQEMSAPPPDPAISDESPQVALDGIQKSNLEKYKDNADMLVLPGLLASRREKKITVYGKTSAAKAGDIVEFFLIAQDSGHGYEALAASFAKPSDIHKALLFIGVEPGKPVNQDELRFWPKGERVLMSFGCQACGFKPVRTEQLVVSKTTAKPLPEAGFVFVGSELVGDVRSYAADTIDPESIASTYNEPTTVLDVPRQVPQGDFYGNYHPNPNFLLPTNKLLQIVIEPEYKDDRKRVLNLTLSMNAKPGSVAATMTDIEFIVRDADGKQLNSGGSLNSALGLFSSLSDRGRDPFVTLHFGYTLTIQAAHDISSILSSINTEKGIRVEPPEEGTLYFKAFVPSEQFRDRSKRMAQPWELHLSKSDVKVSAKLTQIEETWKENQDRPTLKATDYEIADPSALRRTLDEQGTGLPVLFVFASPSLTLGELMTFLKSTRSTHPTVHVFLEK
jgi:hypothetical protein